MPLPGESEMVSNVPTGGMTMVDLDTPMLFSGALMIRVNGASTRVATLRDVQEVLAKNGLELCPIGSVNWTEDYPMREILEKREAELSKELETLRARISKK
jgi:hypothetical protein